MVGRVTRRSIAALAAPETPKAEPAQLSSPLETPGPQQTRKRKAAKQDPVTANAVPASGVPATPNTSRKRAHTGVVKKDEDVNELPHNLGSIPELPVADTKPPKKSRKPRTSSKVVPVKGEGTQELVKKAASASKSPKKKAKGNTYGLTPGSTPYPNWPHPTAEECEEVTRLLSSVHGKVEAPKTIPMPSLNVSGCGEVPSVLDALIRTRLSAATSGTNSSRAFAGLVQKFGVLQEGVGKGSVDWNKVRLADTKDVFEAIKSGGLADVKSKDIKKILQMVWEENQARREALTTSSKEALGSANEPADEKNAEVAKAEQDVISLDHLHLLSNDDVFNALTKYPGIGAKTASCVMLFCLQRPSFAVDTHVFRLCTWLGWVPPKGDPAGLKDGAKGEFKGPTRDSTFAHCEVRVPDHLKYPLHQLFIKHGKTCPRCRAITGENSQGWEKGCVIDHLVTRTGVRKGSGTSPSSNNSRKVKVKGRKSLREETDEESSELSDLGSDDEKTSELADDSDN